MLELKRKQVKGIIDLLTSEPIKNRPLMQNLTIIGNYGYITDGYLIVRFKLEHFYNKNFKIELESLKKWYKLSTSVDHLTEFGMRELMEEIPDYKLLPFGDIYDTHKIGGSYEKISLNAKLLNIYSIICDNHNISIQPSTSSYCNSLYLTCDNPNITGKLCLINKE